MVVKTHCAQNTCWLIIVTTWPSDTIKQCAVCILTHMFSRYYAGPDTHACARAHTHTHTHTNTHISTL